MPSKAAVLIENIPFTIDPVRIMREMRIPASIKSLDEITEKPVADGIKKAIDKGYPLIAGKGIYRTVPLTGVEGENVVGPEVGDLFHGAHMVKLLGESAFVTLLVVTIGSALEEEVERLQQVGEMSDAYALEMVGGWMADYMADRVDERIEREVKKNGFGRTMRFSPGYGDWGLENQPTLLRLAGAERIGVTLNESHIMLPRKSVSAVIGWQTQA